MLWIVVANNLKVYTIHNITGNYSLKIMFYNETIYQLYRHKFLFSYTIYHY
jgi:hypothetical protein